jgi:AcrR family transcriptional regulator
MTRVQEGVETAERLLAAASEVFGEVGYGAATLREICRRGQSNIAGVNYHFRDKEQLYAAVLERAVHATGEGLATLAPDPHDPAEEKLRRFVYGFLYNLLGSDRPAQLLRLVAHEMVEPTPALEFVVERAARPVNEILQSIVTELLGKAADLRLVRDCTHSVLAQCSSYYNCEAIIRHLDQINVHDPATIEHLAEHVFSFSLGGIRSLAARGPSSEQESIRS